jgi:hypothetical protein
VRVRMLPLPQRLVLVPLVLQNLVVETLVVLESDLVLMLLLLLQGLTLERLVLCALAVVVEPSRPPNGSCPSSRRPLRCGQ